MTTYPINEIFLSIQGEGKDTGLPCVFIRFSGCNLSCSFCDTDFTEEYEMSIEEIVKKVFKLTNGIHHLIVFTGGEPTLYNLNPLIKTLSRFGFRFGIETNGANAFDENKFFSISLSPKVPCSECKVTKCHSLKLIYPYLEGAAPDDYKTFLAVHRTIQPIVDEENTILTMNYLNEAIKEVIKLGNGWKLGVQVHKLIGAK